MIRSGRIAATVLGALEVAENGDLANWMTPGRCFGMGGAMDLVNGVPKVIIAMELCTRDGKPKILKKCSLPLTGKACVNHIVTEYCVLDVTSSGLLLREIRAGYTVDDIQDRIEPKLMVADDLIQMKE
jgi:3-oxoacid CoA-transferase subunit B/acetate CoA/acetoacetate CoA-transferase beta subunit